MGGNRSGDTCGRVQTYGYAHTVDVYMHIQACTYTYRHAHTCGCAHTDVHIHVQTCTHSHILFPVSFFNFM